MSTPPPTPLDLDALGRQVLGARMPLVVADAQAPDQPLVFVNDAFCELTGYTAEESIGRNCRFLQGHHTSPEAMRSIGEALRAGRSIAVRLLNYRRDGLAFWNDLHIAPIMAGKAPRYFVGTQLDVTRRVLASDPVLSEEASALLKSGADARSDRVQELVTKAAPREGSSETA